MKSPKPIRFILCIYALLFDNEPAECSPHPGQACAQVHSMYMLAKPEWRGAHCPEGGRHAEYKMCLWMKRLFTEKTMEKLSHEFRKICDNGVPVSPRKEKEMVCTMVKKMSGNIHEKKMLGELSENPGARRWMHFFENGFKPFLEVASDNAKC